MPDMEIATQKELLTQHRSGQSEEPKTEIQSASSSVTVDLGEEEEKYFIIIVLAFSHTQLT